MPTEVSVLVIDDEPAIRRVLEAALQLRGYDVFLADTADAGLQLAAAIEPDVIIVDLGLPDLDGIEVCRRLRRWNSNPIVVLTVEDGEDRKVEAFDSGADDYVSKPFSMPELLARVRVAAKHRRALAQVNEPGIVTIGRVNLDVAAHEAIVDGQPVQLARKAFAMLAALARNAGHVTPNRILLAAGWGPDATRLELVRGQVHLLRRKLDPVVSGIEIISEPGIGYRLVTTEDT